MRAQRIGAWWSKDAEIEIVALDEESGEILFGECKWTQRPVEMTALMALREKARRVDWRPGQRREHYALFSRSGFSQELLQAAGRGEVLLFCDPKGGLRLRGAVGIKCQKSEVQK